MYYFKTFYEDGTHDFIKNKKALHDPRRQVCATCCGIRRVSIFTYYWNKLVTAIKYYNK
jgi:hypothetical protein